MEKETSENWKSNKLLYQITRKEKWDYIILTCMVF